jgi:serine/threonine-protein kinase RsbW
MKVRLALHLPREQGSVPLVRRILAATLGTVGVAEDCSDDILLALAEACSNAVAHAEPADCYEVSVNIDAEQCLIEVVDAGSGFDPSVLPTTLPDLDEAGRGLHIIRAVADQFDLRSNNPTGMAVRFAKRLDGLPTSGA